MTDTKTMHSPTILMCPPDYYGIEYEINPWMHQERQADHTLAVRQWRQFHEILQSLGAAIELLPPVPGLPDLVFTANAALIHRQKAIISRFRHPQRQGEEEYDQRWLADHGFHVQCLPEDLYFEGAGDALFCGETLLAGYRTRSHAQPSSRRAGAGVPCVADGTNRRLLLPPGHLLLPTRLRYRDLLSGAFDAYGRQALESVIANLIPVDREEAKAFACNAVVLNKTVVTNTGCPDLHRKLTEAGFDPVATPLGEFVKAGGSAKCLTLRLDGEEAAAWRRSSP